MNTTNQQDEIEIDLREIFGLIRSRIWIILIVGIIAAVAAGLGSKLLLTPIYTSTTKLFIVNKAQSISSLSLTDLQLGTQLTKDYMVLVKSRPVTEQVIKNLELDMQHEDMLGIMTVSNQADTRILEITVRYPDALMAKEIVDEFAAVSAKRIAMIMDIQEPNVAEEGHMATNQTSPNIKKNAVIAGILGIVGATFVICLLYIMDDTIKSSEDIERYLGLTTIGLIPIEEDAAILEMQKRKKQKKHRKKKNKGRASESEEK